MTNNISIGKVNPFSVNINKLNITKASPSRYSPAHIHDLCEIYVNLTGNVSFIVENNIYAIQAGDIVITRPYEYHHCLYNDDSDHLHYWFLFSPHENSELFNFFLEAERGTNNLIRLPEDILDKFLGLCDKITRINPSHQISCLYVFFEIISYISNGLAKYNVQDENKNLPQNVKKILTYINENYASIKSINELAATFYISITTLERYFKRYLSMTQSGFEDYSHFITIFKKKFHTTPLKYKKAF